MKKLIRKLPNCILLLFAVCTTNHGFAEDPVDLSLSRFESFSRINQTEVEKFFKNIALNNPAFFQDEAFSDSSLYYKELTLNISKIVQHLDTLQDAALRQNLESFGIEMSCERSAYENLSYLSKKNASRISQTIQYKKTLPLEIEDLIDSIQFQPAHFSKSGHEDNFLPIFSSRILAELRVLSCGQNSSNRFNREIIRFDNNVFFFPYSYDLKGSSRYGGSPTFLDQDYAKSKAWISPTSMDPRHLIAWSDRLDAQNQSYDFENQDTVEFFLSLKRKLNGFVFNYDDFIAVNRQALKFYFEKLQFEDLDKYESLIQDLENRENVHFLIQRAWECMGIPRGSGFELKVPVAIPYEMTF